jgi:hypothetical protein
MSLKVIGAGLGRTGTTSLKLALEQLGFAPCYYTEMLLTHPAHITLWERVLDGQPDWDTIFEGFRATMSGPANSFYRELSEYYPSAKVILTVRDPERWHASITSTINSDDFQQLLSQGPAAKLMARVRETRLV